MAVTMRTPGGDFELAVGFLFTEGLITPHVRRVAYCDTLPGEDQRYNIVAVTLERPFDHERLNRNFYATSSCGVCGRRPRRYRGALRARRRGSRGLV